MQLKQFYNIATKVSSTKSGSTSGDLPDCWMEPAFYISQICQLSDRFLNDEQNVGGVIGLQ